MGGVTPRVTAPSHTNPSDATARSLGTGLNALLFKIDKIGSFYPQPSRGPRERQQC